MFRHGVNKAWQRALAVSNYDPFLETSLASHPQRFSIGFKSDEYGG